MKKYAKLIIALGLAGGIMLTGCQKNESGSAEPTATPEPTEAAEEVTPEPTAMAAEEPEPTEDPIPDGYVVSYLTGEYVPEAIGRRRPVAVMIIWKRSVPYEAAVIIIFSTLQDLMRSIRIMDSLLMPFLSWNYRR